MVLDDKNKQCRVLWVEMIFTQFNVLRSSVCIYIVDVELLSRLLLNMAIPIWGRISSMDLSSMELTSRQILLIPVKVPSGYLKGSGDSFEKSFSYTAFEFRPPVDPLPRSPTSAFSIQRGSSGIP